MSNHLVLNVSASLEKRFVIRLENSSSYLCANSEKMSSWHYANNHNCTGVTYFETLMDAQKVSSSLKDKNVIVEFKGPKR